MKAHAGTGDRMQFRSLRRQVQPTVCAICKRFGLIGEVFGGRGGQGRRKGPPPVPDHLSAAAPPNRHALTRRCRPAPPDRRMEIQSASRSGPMRSPANQLRSAGLDQGKPVPPSFRAALNPVIQCAEATGHTGKTRGMTRLCFPPIVEDLGFTRFGPWSGRQILQLLFHGAGQEPKIVLRPLFHLLSVEKVSITFTIKDRVLGLHMCKISNFLHFTQGFCRSALTLLI